MITNDRQYKVAKAQLERCKKKLFRLDTVSAWNFDSQWTLRDHLRFIIKALQGQIAEYEAQQDIHNDEDEPPFPLAVV